jgi:hypothetical protein
MRNRSTLALGVALLWAAACGGEPFTRDGVAGSGGASAGSAGRLGGNSGSNAKAGSSGKGGSPGKGGDASLGGSAVGVGGLVSVGGVVGISGSMTSEAGAPNPGATCSDPSECDASSRCVEATCDDGVCGEKNLPDGPFSLQVPGDCKQARCESGKEVLVVEPNDSDDKVECTTDSCDQNGVAKHTPKVGAACENGGLCGPDGKCAVCEHTMCAADACHVTYCAGDQCQLAPKPVGTICPNNANDSNQCNAQGACVDCVDNGGCNEAQVCNVDQQTCQSD